MQGCCCCRRRGGDKNKIHLRNIVSRQLLHNVTEIFLPKKTKLCWTRKSVERLFSASLGLNQTFGFIFVLLFCHFHGTQNVDETWSNVNQFFSLFFFPSGGLSGRPCPPHEDLRLFCALEFSVLDRRLVFVFFVFFSFSVHSNHSVIWLLQPVKMIYNIF